MRLANNGEWSFATRSSLWVQEETINRQNGSAFSASAKLQSNTSTTTKEEKYSIFLFVCKLKIEQEKVCWMPPHRRSSSSHRSLVPVWLAAWLYVALYGRWAPLKNTSLNAHWNNMDRLENTEKCHWLVSATGCGTNRQGSHSGKFLEPLARSQRVKCSSEESPNLMEEANLRIAF